MRRLLADRDRAIRERDLLLQQHGSSQTIPLLLAGSLEVEVEADETQFRSMTAHIEKNWKRLGEREPHWSVVTDDRFKQNSFDEFAEEFYGSGRDTVDFFKAATQRCGVDLTAYATCLELGCGVGRVTLWLARLFREVTAVDISPSHLRIAEETLQRHGLDNVRLVRLEDIAATESFPEIDVFVSLIVLQHNPPPMILRLLETLLGKLRPGGIAYFQVPTYDMGYRFVVHEYLDRLDRDAGEAVMEMHCLPQHLLFAMFDRVGCKVLEVREDCWTTNPMGISNSFLVRKG